MLGSRQRAEMSKVFIAASIEAQRMGDRRVGTEHLALALLADPASDTAQALDVTLDQARAALLSLDHAALAAVGIDAIDPGPAAAPKARIRLTPGARAVFVSLRGSRDGKPLHARNVLLGLLDRHRPDPAAELLDALGVDRAQVRARLTAA